MDSVYSQTSDVESEGYMRYLRFSLYIVLLTLLMIVFGTAIFILGEIVRASITVDNPQPQ